MPTLSTPGAPREPRVQLAPETRVSARRSCSAARSVGWRTRRCAPSGCRHRGLRSRIRFLTSRPAPTSSEKATAISATTSPLPMRRPDPLLVRAVGPRRTADASLRHPPARGAARRRRRHRRRWRRRRRTRRRGRRWRSSTHAGSCGARERHERLQHPGARARRRGAPPVSESSRASRVSCRARSLAPAPSARRIASSRRRARPEASSRFATFRAGDQQHAKYGAEQHLQRRPHVADGRFHVRLHIDAVIVAELARAKRLSQRARMSTMARARAGRRASAAHRSSGSGCPASRDPALRCSGTKDVGAAMRKAGGHDADHLVRPPR